QPARPGCASSACRGRYRGVARWPRVPAPGLYGCSSVTNRATGNDAGLPDLVLVHELATQPERVVRVAVLILLVRGLPSQIEDLGAWPQVILRVPVAINAPLHHEGRRLVGEGHVVDAAVTRGAADALVNVDA